MSSLRAICCALAVATLAIGCLPAATRCDSSYYEKYYSARRFLPPKRPALLVHNFTVRLESVDADQLGAFERVALVGDLRQLGAWRPEGAVLLNRSREEHDVWQGSVALPANSTVNYRYFVAAVSGRGSQSGTEAESGPETGSGSKSGSKSGSRTGALLVRRWESALEARSFNTTATGANRTDTFGSIGGRREVRRGWLNAGHVVQFKLFRNPIHFDAAEDEDESRPSGERLFVKVQPVEPLRLTPILPSARAHTEYVRMEYGNSRLREQPEFGVPYEPDDIVVFHTTVARLEDVAYQVRLYRTRPEEEGDDLVHLIGHQVVYPEELLRRGSTGNFSVRLVSPVWLSAIGRLDVEFLVIDPLPAPIVDFRTTFADYWRSNWTALDGGHRGLGKSLTVSASVAPALVENTLGSLQAAGDLGADLVEFDVMLTSDLVPIIHHDYVVYVCMESKTPTSRDDLTEVLIKDVTYEQLRNLKTYRVVGSKIVEYQAHNNVEQVEHRLFPRFEDVLAGVNRSVGFDIEVKWPQRRATGELESVQTIDKNVYVDRIVETMLRHGCGRLSFFSSFDADICSLLRFKQNMYPVVFLSSSKEANFADPRSDTIYDSVNNAQAFDLFGIAPNALFIEKDPGWLQVARRQDKQVFLWGDALKDSDSIAWFKSLAPTGLIYDRVDLWLPVDKRSAFGLEDDLPEFFRLQCAPGTRPARPVNKTVESILSNVNLF